MNQIWSESSREIFRNDDYTVFHYPSRWFNYYLKGVDNMYFKKKVRFFLAHLAGGKIYYLYNLKNKDIAGYCMISKGKAFQYSFADSNDIIVGPIYISGPYRGKRLSILLLREVLRDNNDCRSAFAYVHRINKQSNALFMRLGFEPRANVEISRVTRKVNLSAKENTDYRLYVLPVNCMEKPQ